MMTDLEGANTTNMLKVHVAADALTTDRSSSRAERPDRLVRLSDGDLSDVPEGAILALPRRSTRSSRARQDGSQASSTPSGE